jgi:phage terminase large subunit-like protein
MDFLLNTTDTIKFIVNLLQELPIKRMVIEVNSIGKTFADLLKQQISKYNIKTQVIQFTTTNKSKREIIETLSLNIQNGSISLLDDNQLKLQMINFEVKTTATGLVTYGNSSNEIHDDIVMSIALALYGFKCSSYVVR